MNIEPIGPNDTFRVEPRTADEHRWYDALGQARTAAGERVAADLGGADLRTLMGSIDDRRFALLRVAAPFLDDVVDDGLIDRLVASGPISHPEVALVQPGRGESGPLPDDLLLQPTRPELQSSLHTAAVDGALADGATLLFNMVDHHDTGSLRRLCDDLELATGLAVNTNAYLSRDGAEGFGAHWDDHDVLVMQLDGSKLWEVFGPTHLSPSRGYIDDLAVGTPVWSGVLRPGHALFIPRGWAHRVLALGGTSRHLTIGFTRATFTTVLAAASARVEGLPAEAATQAIASLNESALWRMVAGQRAKVGARVRSDLAAHDRFRADPADPSRSTVCWTAGPAFADRVTGNGRPSNSEGVDSTPPALRLGWAGRIVTVVAGQTEDLIGLLLDPSKPVPGIRTELVAAGLARAC